MNRTDELSDRLIDGVLTDAEAAELESLLAADPAARTRHLALLELEAALRGSRTDLDLAAATVERIEAERAERTVAAVMAAVADRPRPAPVVPRMRRRVLIGAAFAALTATLLVAFWLARPTPEAAPNPAVPEPPEFARLTTFAGSVEVVGRDAPAAVGAGLALVPGQVVRTVGEESAAVVEFPDRSRVELNPETAVRFDAGDDASPRRLVLLEGQLTAVVTGRPTVVATDTAEVVATRGSFALWSSGPGSVRVEPKDGDVRVVRGGPAHPSEPVVVNPGRAAFVRDAASPVRVEPPYLVATTPRARLDFPGALSLAFTPDGELWAASAKQWVRWRPGSPGDRRLFTSPAANDGPAAILTPDLRSLVASRADDKDHGIVVRDLPGGGVRHALPVRVGEPRFLCAAPDASWVATTEGKPARVRVWDVATGTERFAREFDAGVFCTAATPDGRFLAAEVSDLRRGTDNRIVFLDAATGAEAFALPTRRRQVTAMAFTPDGRFLAAGFNGAVQLWDVPARRLVRTVEGFERVVTRLAFSPGGRLVAAGTQDGQVWVWSAATGRRVQVIDTGGRGVRALAFGPDGKTLATATNKAPVALWEIAPTPADTEPDL